jgi:hypothetical protein
MSDPNPALIPLPLAVPLVPAKLSHLHYSMPLDLASFVLDRKEAPHHA